MYNEGHVQTVFSSQKAHLDLILLSLAMTLSFLIITEDVEFS